MIYPVIIHSTVLQFYILRFYILRFYILRFCPPPPDIMLRFTSILSLILLASACQKSQPTEETQGQPNVAVIFIDDMGYADPSCFGNPLMKTPNIDKLADNGIKFTNFYVNSPICSPSRVSINTGKYPISYKIHSYINWSYNNKKRGMADFLDPTAPTISRNEQ